MPLFDYQDEIIDQGRIAQARRNQRWERPRRIWRGFKRLVPWLILVGLILPAIGQLFGLGTVHPVLESYIEAMRVARVALWDVLSEIWRRIGALNGWW